MILSTFLLNASAYNLLPYNLNGGVGNWGNYTRSYWIDSSANEYTHDIWVAYSEWTNTNHILRTPISWKRTNTQKDGTIEMHGKYLDRQVLGMTEYYMYGNKVKPNQQNWGWSKITLNKNYNSTYLLGTIAHEIGHAMGLDHYTYKYSVMCQKQHGREVASAQHDDLSGINAKYN